MGDIHLGRQPSRVPPGLDGRNMSPAVAWRRTVDRAIEEGVDAVVLAGDVVERADDRIEAYGDLQDGVRRLIEAGVAVLGIAGNHDTDALPRLARRIEGFQLLGEGGRWEAADVGEVRIVGWSFPRPVVREDPLLDPDLRTLTDGAPGAVVGLLHCDRDASGSPHAPTTSARLSEAPGDAWLLGHIHKPDALGEGPRGYLGCLSGMDPGEPGPRGPWMITVSGPGRVAAQHLPLAPIRYVPLAVDISTMGDDGAQGADLEDAALDLLNAAVDAAAAELSEATRRDLVAAAVRLSLEGRCARRAEAVAAFEQVRKDFCVQRGDVSWFVEAVPDRSRPAPDLEALAAGRHPAASLARRLLALERDDDEGGRLVREGIHRLREAAAGGAWSGLEAPTLTPETVRERLLTAGYDALEQLEASRVR